MRPPRTFDGRDSLLPLGKFWSVTQLMRRDAASAFANCGQAVTPALGSYVPEGDIRIAVDSLALVVS
jgi:hypothetical protein